MPTDPYTGLYSTQVSYQPTGALGAVTELLNAQKAQNIANTLQQQREAQAGMSQAQLGEYEEKHRREQQLRDLMASPELQGKTFDERINAAIGSGLSDLGQWAPYARAGESARARLGVAELNSRAKLASTWLTQGGTPAGLPVFLKSMDTPPDQIQDVIAQMGPLGEKPLAVPGSVETKNKGLGHAAEAKAEEIETLTPELVKATRALAALRNAKAQLAGVTAATTGQLSALYRNVAQYDKFIKDLTVDKYGMEIEPTPAVQKLIDTYQAEKTGLVQLIIEKSTALPAAAKGKGGGALLPPNFLGGSTASPEQKAKASGTQNPTAAPASVMKFNPATGTIE